jgi:hypothetical protein
LPEQRIFLASGFAFDELFQALRLHQRLYGQVIGMAIL